MILQEMKCFFQMATTFLCKWKKNIKKNSVKLSESLISLNCNQSNIDIYSET